MCVCVRVCVCMCLNVKFSLGEGKEEVKGSTKVWSNRLKLPQFEGSCAGRHTTFIFCLLARIVSVKERAIKSVHFKVAHASLTNILIFIVSYKFILVAPECVDYVNLTEYEAGSDEVKLSSFAHFSPPSLPHQQNCTFVHDRVSCTTSDSHQNLSGQILK